MKNYTNKLKYFITWHMKPKIQSKYHKNYQEISNNHIQNISIHIKKYLKKYENK